MAVRNYKISYRRSERARAACLLTRLTAPLDFTALQRQTFPPAVRIAHRARARHKNDSSLDFTNRPHRPHRTAGVSAYDTNSPLRR